MSWENIFKEVDKMRKEGESSAWDMVRLADDPAEEYLHYLDTQQENEIIIEFLKKIRQMDEKLDEILEKLG